MKIKFLYASILFVSAIHTCEPVPNNQDTKKTNPSNLRRAIPVAQFIDAYYVNGGLVTIGVTTGGRYVETKYSIQNGESVVSSEYINYDL